MHKKRMFSHRITIIFLLQASDWQFSTSKIITYAFQIFSRMKV